jgi:hypothetical protein
MALRPGGGLRLSRDQLDRLAAELVEQLDQEYTSLLSSIEEVQGLMEAEVAGASLLPSLEDLDAFVASADAALKHLEGLEARREKACRVETAELEAAAASKAEDSSRRTTASSADSPTDRSLCEVSSAEGDESTSEAECAAESPKACESTDDELLWPQSKWTSPDRIIAGELVPSDASLGVERIKLEGEEVQPTREMTQVESRPRWADLSDDDDRFGIPMLAAPKAHAGGATRSGTAPARAMCSKCKEELGKESFSRRAWRQARGLGGAGLVSGARESAVCRDCSLET